MWGPHPTKLRGSFLPRYFDTEAEFVEREQRQSSRERMKERERKRGKKGKERRDGGDGSAVVASAPI